MPALPPSPEKVATLAYRSMEDERAQDFVEHYGKLEKALVAAKGTLTLIERAGRPNKVANLIVPSEEEDCRLSTASSEMDRRGVTEHSAWMVIPGITAVELDWHGTMGVGNSAVYIPLFKVTTTNRICPELKLLTPLASIGVDSDLERISARIQEHDNGQRDLRLPFANAKSFVDKMIEAAGRT